MWHLPLGYPGEFFKVHNLAATPIRIPHYFVTPYNLAVVKTYYQVFYPMLLQFTVTLTLLAGPEKVTI
jgi:hypothetical protein